MLSRYIVKSDRFFKFAFVSDFDEYNVARSRLNVLLDVLRDNEGEVRSILDFSIEKSNLSISSSVEAFDTDKIFSERVT